MIDTGLESVDVAEGGVVAGVPDLHVIVSVSDKRGR